MTINSELPFGTNLIKSGILIIIFFSAGLGGWLFLAPIESAVVASGVLTVDSSRKTIQHLEGGIIKNILVKDGDSVQVGDELIHLQDVQQRSHRDQLQAQLDGATAGIARLTAERHHDNRIIFTSELMNRASTPSVEEAMSSQVNIFNSKNKLYKETIAVLTKNVSGLEEEQLGITGQISAALKQLRLIDEELSMLNKLKGNGFVSKSKILESQRKQAELEGAVSEFRAMSARVKQKLLEASLKISEFKALIMKELDEELRLLQARRYDLNQQYNSAEDMLKRTIIYSPITGTVVSLQVHTQGGVILAGMPILDIVPSQEDLIVQVPIDLQDIDEVYTGLPANIELTAFNRRERVAVDGVVTTVSADTLRDSITGQFYYQARIAFKMESLTIKNMELQPGMAADVTIKTGARTPLDYLLTPITRSLNKALREK